jgi:hypothetical protein
MIGGNAKGGAATPPSCVTGQPQSLNGQPQVYPLPAQYSKPQSYRVDGTVLRFKGGMALMLDRMIAAQPRGIDRSATLQWIANIADTAMRIGGSLPATACCPMWRGWGKANERAGLYRRPNLAARKTRQGHHGWIPRI